MGAVVEQPVSTTSTCSDLVVSSCRGQTLHEGRYGLPSEGLTTQASQEQEYCSNLGAKVGC